ncbi:hypothetical protein [Streptomyces sp. NPDC057253]|uniref:hypothetical protein n=1 Tax=Streptomyces sp. NPDC057253 TaxID=3346069 RepID=UPI00364201F1
MHEAQRPQAGGSPLRPSLARHLEIEMATAIRHVRSELDRLTDLATRSSLLADRWVRPARPDGGTRKRQ